MEIYKKNKHQGTIFKHVQVHFSMLKQLLSKTLGTRFEGFPPIQYMRKDLMELVRLGHVAYKVDGIRGFLFVTHEMVCWLSNDSRLSIPLRPSLYTGISCSIFEVFIHLDTSMIRIHDVLLYNRMLVTSRPYLERIELVRKWLTNVGCLVNTNPILYSRYNKHHIHNNGWIIDCVDIVDTPSFDCGHPILFKGLFCKYGSTTSNLYWFPDIVDHVLFKFLVKTGSHYKLVKKIPDVFRQAFGDRTLFLKSTNGRNIPISYVKHSNGMIDGPGVFKWRHGRWEFISQCLEYDTLEIFNENFKTIMSHPCQKSRNHT